MATAGPIETVQVVNFGLAAERQRVLRDTLTEYFDLLSKRSNMRRQLQYIVNRETLALDQVLRMNEGADALFTSFPFEAQSGGTPANLPEPMLDANGRELPPAPANLRFPLIAEVQRAIDKGALRYRKLILVDDIYAKIDHALRVKIPVQLTHFIDDTRTKMSPPVVIRALAQVSALDEKESAQAGGDPAAPPPHGIPVGRICTITIADVPFDGIVHMPEQNNRFVLKDQTILDTTRKLFTMRGARIGMGQEKIEAENHAYIQVKRVLVVLEPELELIISERLKFDRMENLWRANSPEQALQILTNAKAQGVVEYFESEGFDVLMEAASQEERDRLMLTLLGPALPKLIERELAAAKNIIGALQGPDLDSVLGGVPMPLMDQVLTALQNKSMERYLAYVPVKIRDRVVLEFLTKPDHVRAAWKGLGEAERKETQQNMVPHILAQLYLTNTPLYAQRFPAIKLTFANTVNSQTISRLRPDEQAQTFALVSKTIEGQKASLQTLQQNLPPPEIEQLLLDVIVKRPADSYARLSPLVRKQIWSTIGKEFRPFITASLNILDKVEIVKGLREGALDVLFEHPAYLEFVRNPRQQNYASTLFLTLKKFTSGESKTATLKRLLTDPEQRTERAEIVPRFLAAPENKALNQKLSELIDVLDFRFDALVCTKAHLEPIKAQPALAGAVVILVDTLVDSALLKTIQSGAVSREEYSTLAANVDHELQETRKRLEEKAGADPAGVYLVETMLDLNEMAGQALSGNLTAAAVEKLDTRESLRHKLLGGIKQQIADNHDALGKEEALDAQLSERLKSTEQRLEQSTKEADQALAAAKALMAECDQIVQAQGKVEHEKNAVASTQRDLSVEFFKLIQPLILEQLKSLSGPFGGLLKMVGIGKDKEGSGSERVIFKFSDAEIEHILKYKIVFCTKDELLLQFILTCLRIDKLEDSLFTMATPETLPSAGIDILFYGPGYKPEDFASRVKEKRIVQFADEAFMKRLQANEAMKAKTKQTIADLDAQLKAKNAQMTEANTQADGIRDQVRKLSQTLAGVQEELAALHKKINQTRERSKTLADQVDVLESRFKEFDEKFKSVRQRLTVLTTGSHHEEVAARLSQELAEDLMKLNEELARLMRVKSVKDVGSYISKSTQQRILKQIEVKERYPSNRGPVTRVIVADDGSNLAQNLKRSFVQALGAYFKLRDGALEATTISRLNSQLDPAVTEERLPKANLLVILSQDPGDNFQALRQLVSRMKRRLPLAHPIVLVPFGDISSLDPKSGSRRNLLGIKDRCPLVNLSIADYADPQVVVRLLHDKVPPAAPAHAAAAPAAAQRSSA